MPQICKRFATDGVKRRGRLRPLFCDDFPERLFAYTVVILLGWYPWNAILSVFVVAWHPTRPIKTRMCDGLADVWRQ
jgi:hypothetical protein